MVVNSYRESPEALIEVFGTPHPSRDAIIKWKARWREEKGKIKVNNFNAAIKLLEESGVDPLFYQFWADPGIQKDFYVVFWKEEHEVFFKLHTGIA
jgi:hypothetical protein